MAKVSAPTISRLERGLTSLRQENIDALEEELGMTIADLFKMIESDPDRPPEHWLKDYNELPKKNRDMIDGIIHAVIKAIREED